MYTLGMRTTEQVGFGVESCWMQTGIHLCRSRFASNIEPMSCVWISHVILCVCLYVCEYFFKWIFVLFGSKIRCGVQCYNWIKELQNKILEYTNGTIKVDSRIWIQVTTQVMKAFQFPFSLLISILSLKF